MAECPTCGKAVKAGGLGSHRRLAHGYRVSAGARRLVERGADGLYHCPECLACGFDPFQGFETATGLGAHRRYIHGVVGTSKASISTRKRGKAPKPNARPTRYCALGRHTGCRTMFGGHVECGCECHATARTRRSATVTRQKSSTPT